MARETTPATLPLTAVAPAEPLLRRLGVLLGFLLVGVIFTWPMVLSWGHGVIQKGGVPVDSGQGIWNLWWGYTAISQRWPLFLTSYLFFPQSVDLFWQPVSMPSAVMVWPMIAGFGPVAGFNTVTLLSFAIGGYASYRLARAGGLTLLPALLAGFVVIASPYHLQRILGGSMELIAMQWLPVYVLMLMHALEHQTITATLAAAGALLLTTLSAQYYGLFSAVYSLFHVGLVLILTRDWAIRRRRLAVAIGIAAIWAATLLLYVWPLDRLGANTVRNWYEVQVFHSMALVDLIPLNMLHPLWGPWASQTLEAWHPIGVEIGATFGLGVLGLMLYALVKAWRQTWPWLGLTIVLLILALGPELKVSDWHTGLPLPFLLLDLVTPFRNASRPSLFVALALLPIALVAGLGLQLLMQRGRGLVAPILIVGLIIVEYLVAPWAIVPIRSDPRYAELLQAEPVPGAIIELPVRTNASQQMLNQICHGRPLAGGYLARTPDYRPAEHASAFASVWHRTPLSNDTFSANLAGDLAALGITYATLEAQGLSASDAELLGSSLDVPGISLIDADETLRFYRIDPTYAHPGLYPHNEDWFAPEGDAQRIWRWMGASARLGMLAAWSTPVLAQFEATAYGEDRPLTLQLDGQPIASTGIPTGAYRVIRVLMPPGTTTLELASPASLAPEGRTISLAVSRLALATTEGGVPFVPMLPVLTSGAHAPCQ
ncbi:hypothetical protein EYB53_007280 [Candidatus Chloroploca sp. M-50]|uniref:YfhO family protein n=1 Tax=Candidatus Chloroploca mongolica TaxID=2528176 RepID=A0ABS4D7V6_9CHLR|nr:hypothetical protein [Candidatus Chloroploca mongolica]MBP1465504.1 hypothetical protein [Candidatus Chloroploca mongolica]